MLAAAPEAKGERNDCAKHLVDDEEEQTGEYNQHQYEPRRDEGLAPRGPNDLRGLGAHLLNEFEWIGHGFDVGFEVFDAAGDEASQKNSRRGASRRRATPTSYRKRRLSAKRNVTI
jgi:hypothetical protein